MAAFSHGVGGSAVDRIGVDPDNLLQVPEHEITEWFELYSRHTQQECKRSFTTKIL